MKKGFRSLSLRHPATPAHKHPVLTGISFAIAPTSGRPAHKHPALAGFRSLSLRHPATPAAGVLKRKSKGTIE